MEKQWYMNPTKNLEWTITSDTNTDILLHIILLLSYDAKVVLVGFLTWSIHLICIYCPPTQAHRVAAAQLSFQFILLC